MTEVKGHRLTFWVALNEIYSIEVTNQKGLVLEACNKRQQSHHLLLQDVGCGYVCHFSADKNYYKASEISQEVLL